MEASVKENIHFMWLAGMSQPDHNTINRFRSDRLGDVLKEIFSQVVLLLVDNGLINLKQVYLNGTKIEANVNRFPIAICHLYADEGGLHGHQTVYATWTEEGGNRDGFAGYSP